MEDERNLLALVTAAACQSPAAGTSVSRSTAFTLQVYGQK